MLRCCYEVRRAPTNPTHIPNMTSTSPPPRDDTNTLPHQTTVALSQIHNLLRQATDIMAHLHTRFLHHIGQADPTFHRPFTQLPPPPTYSINLPSPTSSCDSAPPRPRVRPPPQPSINSEDTPSPIPPHPSTHRLANAKSHHLHSTHMQTGMPGMVTLIVASWSSKPTPGFDPIGSLFPDGSDTPLSSAKLDGRSFKIYKDYRTPNHLNPLHFPQIQRR